MSIILNADRPLPEGAQKDIELILDHLDRLLQVLVEPRRRREWKRGRSLAGVIATVGSGKTPTRSAAADAPVELWATPA